MTDTDTDTDIKSIFLMSLFLSPYKLLFLNFFKLYRTIQKIKTLKNDIF